MKKIAIVYWSGSGNTEKMALCIAEGVKSVGGEAALMGPEEFTADRFAEFDAVAFGCPAMGAEVLEEDTFEPMFAGLEKQLSGKKIALFGSYGWGDGQWMRDWCARSEESGADLYDAEGLMIHENPSEEGQESCRELGVGLVRW